MQRRVRPDSDSPINTSFAIPRKADSAAPDPFDARGAVALPENPILSGPAYIIDGDSLVIQRTQIRLFGVDAPEMNHPLGTQAKWALIKLCKGHSVSAKVLAIDTHGRTVALCTLPDGRDLSAEMVKAGLALDWAKFSGGIYRNLETPDARRKLWLADARQKGRMYVWAQFDAKQAAKQRQDQP
ncbi:hypothetical protein EGN72_18105 [Pseudorhodobacter sp. E13]|nr:hypothetical protein EGN72_18105 [Pseudorhodobacter sp. E13]